jgi:hypothetical protein
VAALFAAAPSLLAALFLAALLWAALFLAALFLAALFHCNCVVSLQLRVQARSRAVRRAVSRRREPSYSFGERFSQTSAALCKRLSSQSGKAVHSAL